MADADAGPATEEVEDDGPIDLDLGNLDLTTDQTDLSGLEEELNRYENHDVVRDILRTEGSQLRERANAIEGKLHQVELDSIQDYVTESDNLVALQQQIRGCDSILEKMESLLGGFQADLGKISSEIKQLQEQSFTMSIKLRNRKAAESHLGQFVEDLTIPPKLISNILESEVNESYLQYLVKLHSKLEFTKNDERARSSAALQDVEPELEKLRVKASGKVREFLIPRFYSLRKPKTNIQILQQNVLLKFKYFVKFLQQHGPEVYPEVRKEYIETLSRIYRSAISKYLISLGTLQTELVGKGDILGSEEARGGLFGRGGRDAQGKAARPSPYAIGGRAAVLQNMDTNPPLIVHQAEAAGQKFAYDALFRSAYKLLMDTATSEYLFCQEFWAGDGRIFGEIFAAPIAAIEESLNGYLANCHDVIALVLMIRINHEHQVIMSRRRVPCLDSYLDKVNMLLWPRFKAMVDVHLASVRTANEKALFVDDVGGHYVLRRYAELVASVYTLASTGGEGQIDNTMDRLRGAVCDLLLRLSKLFPERRQQITFLVNNCDLVLTTLSDAVSDDPACAGVDRTPTATFFQEQLQQQVDQFVEEELYLQFRHLIDFVKKAEVEYKRMEGSGLLGALPGFGSEEAAPIMREFAAKWKGALEQIHKDVVAFFSNQQRAMDILQRTLSQLLIYYMRLAGPEGILLQRCGAPGAALCKDAISNAQMMLEIKRCGTLFRH